MSTAAAAAGDRGAESPERRDERRRRSEAVDWLRALLGGSGLPLPPPGASDEELRAALADGALLCAALGKLRLPSCPAPTPGEGAAAGSDVGRFVAAVERMGLPSFPAADLDAGPMSAVIICLLALRDRFGSHVGEGLNCSLEGKCGMEFPVRENDHEPSCTISRPELSSISRHTGHDFHEVFHLRHGIYSDMPMSKILEMMKSTSLDNAPTQSLLSFVNSILDEIIEKKNGEIPYHIACLLRKVILEIERRMSTQAEHIRNDAADHALQMKMEEGKIEERQLVDKDIASSMKDKAAVATLTKDKEDMARLLKDKEDIIRLMKEKEEMFMLMKDKEDMVSLKKGRVDDRTQSVDEHEDSKNTILKLKLELESVKSSYEECHSMLKSKKEDVLKLLKDKDNSDTIISKLSQELVVSRRAHKTHIQELENRALKETEEFKQRIKELELKLEDSRKRGRDLEVLLQSKMETWKRKEIMVNQTVGLQIQNIQDLRLSSVSIRHELQNCQKKWSQEISGLGQSLKVLINDAENYHTALDENRKLFNEIQELKGNIRVYCRIRPFLPGDDQKSTTIEYFGENGKLIIGNPARQGKEGSKSFKFNKVFGPTASQDEVFKDIQPLIRSVLDGYNVCIFAYGQTGSGKTYTMTGPENATEKEWGVNYRALNDLFHISRNRGDTIMYEISAQMIEIYNEQIRDLLGSNGPEKRYPFFLYKNTLMESVIEFTNVAYFLQPNGLAVPDATLHPVNSTTDVIELMRTGLANRAVGSTALNERSSRSHSVVTIHIRGVDLKTGTTLRGALHLVDLAGSGHAKTLMFVQINPDVSSYSETMSTLKFAERVSGVELGAAKVNKEGKDIRDLMEQLSLLKHKIAKKDEEINRFQLLKTQTPRARTAKRADSPLKHSSSSPGISSLGSKIQHRRTASGGKAMSIGSRAFSDADNFSEISDRHSESGSTQSVDETLSQKGVIGLPMLSIGEMCQNSADPELACFDYADSEDRLSDISDSGLSMGTETDGSISSVVELTLFPEQDKTYSSMKEQEKAPRTPNDRLISRKSLYNTSNICTTNVQHFKAMDVAQV
ncbi:hypothetical protein EJB05_41221 [Eragrostis curvula]|uniref:Kinesin motor domain-containing protein n=1 Tax=Eragrostis curvula TaxID=38414 RepID=A0A5J9T942_9POAL|nr:hypothetical protein EJB05_41221 [Eragrostis curvula]